MTHLCRAVRKLAAVTTPQEASLPLWRGVRGELPRTFWVPDERGDICAVDMCFMSTSRNHCTPIDYMDAQGPNVLWELQTRLESDSGFHCGASIELLSQFASEQEVLFPPYTMLKLMPRVLPSASIEGRGVNGVQDGGKSDASPRFAVEKARTDTMDSSHIAAPFGTERRCERGKTYLAVSVLPTFL